MKTIEELGREGSTIQDFIDFFETIPRENWCANTYSTTLAGRQCKCAKAHLYPNEPTIDSRPLDGPAIRRLNKLINSSIPSAAIEQINNLGDQRCRDITKPYRELYDFEKDQPILEGHYSSKERTINYLKSLLSA